MSTAPEMSHTGEPAELAEAPTRDLTPLVGELRAAVGDEWVYTQEHQLRTSLQKGQISESLASAQRQMEARRKQEEQERQRAALYHKLV